LSSKKRVAAAPIGVEVWPGKESKDVIFFLKSVSKQGKFVQDIVYTCSCTCNISLYSADYSIDSMPRGVSMTESSLQALGVPRSTANLRRCVAPLPLIILHIYMTKIKRKNWPFLLPGIYSLCKRMDPGDRQRPDPPLNEVRPPLDHTGQFGVGDLRRVEYRDLRAGRSRGNPYTEGPSAGRGYEDHGDPQPRLYTGLLSGLRGDDRGDPEPDGYSRVEVSAPAVAAHLFRRELVDDPLLLPGTDARPSPDEDEKAIGPHIPDGRHRHAPRLREYPRLGVRCPAGTSDDV
jgi:hypothetical protein